METCVSSDFCCGCSACISICPKHALDLEEDNEGFLSPILNKESCINCGLCKKVCPVLNPKKNKSVKTVYAAWGGDEKERKLSSSGGISSVLAKHIINNKGVVFGAVMDNFYVYHDVIDSIDNIYRMQSSKYVQSDMGKCFIKCKELLEDGYNVMFTGTPCQISGLRNFLQKDYDNLLSVDVICHGVPSPGVFRAYVEYLKQENFTATSLTFRDKVYGWNPSHAIALYDDSMKTIFREPGKFNIYIKGFLHNIFNRKSCNYCKFSSVERPGDITLGDFWKIDKYFPEINDKKGISLCIINTEKGRKYFNIIQQDLAFCKEYPIEIAIENQPQLRTPAKCSKLRKEFFEIFKSKVSIEEFLNKKLFKIGIINFHFANNFGAVLVPYALMQIVKKLGYFPEIINYIGKATPFNSKFENFRQKYLNPLSHKFLTREDLIKSSPWWKTIIVGSDQVWRLIDTGIYMLNWVSGKKNLISYAASFGHDYYAGKIPQDEAHVLLSRFDSISVREKSGVDICKYLGVNALHVLDPTLLLTEDDYVKLIKENGGIKINKQYICTVMLKKENYNIIKNAKALEDFNDFDIIDAIHDQHDSFRTVSEWLDAIRSAKYVITDSFHGTVFSIIFKKQFVCIISKNYNGQARIPSLLSTLHIDNNRIYNSIYDINKECFKSKIDYDNVYNYLNIEKEKSLLFLKCALQKPLSHKGKIYTIK